jgi:hypothetical protein
MYAFVGFLVVSIVAVSIALLEPAMRWYNREVRGWNCPKCNSGVTDMIQDERSGGFVLTCDLCDYQETVTSGKLNPEYY